MFGSEIVVVDNFKAKEIQSVLPADIWNFHAATRSPL